MHNESLNKTKNLSCFFGISDGERTSLAVEYIFYELLTYIHFLLAYFNFVPMWTFVIGVIVYIPRWMICLHEMQHHFTPKTINPITRLNLLSLTPLQLGFVEMRDIHMRHHAHPAKPQDPEYYHIKGHWLAGWINVMFSPEISTYHWLKKKKMDDEFKRGVSIRFILFVSLAFAFGWSFLWYLIPVRLAYGSCLYFFSYGLHRKNGDYGTFAIEYPLWLKIIASLVYGEKLLQSVSEHDIHHDYPTIPGQYLRASRPWYTPRASRQRQINPVTLETQEA